MPEAWSRKDERMYEHIRDNAIKDGKSDKRAREIAARTVNKQRREEGRAESTRSSGTGNPYSRLEDRTLVELQNRARELKIDGRSSMSKSGLVEAIRKKNR